MYSILALGFLTGTGHAFEADHLAAVSALINDKSSRKRMLVSGALWGLGHALTLTLVAGAVLILGMKVSPTFALDLEGIVGVMLVFLGGSVFWKLYRDHVHLHKHTHADGTTHTHLHSHAAQPRPGLHAHGHPDKVSLKALFVGIMHGMAGSAALVLATAASLQSPWTGFAYVGFFGVGSILGMVGATMAMSFPLLISARFLSRFSTVLRYAIGTVTASIGVYIIANTAMALSA